MRSNNLITILEENDLIWRTRALKSVKYDVVLKYELKQYLLYRRREDALKKTS